MVFLFALQLEKIKYLSKRIFKSFLPYWVIKYFFHLPKAWFALKFYNNPAKDLTLIGVTGTDGKTTTTTLIYEILKKAGEKTALISTVCAKIGRLNLPTGLHVTSPEPWELQRLLSLIKKRGYKYVVLEVTSHGLDQFRFLGLNFEVGLITNITHEHLDYHKTYNNYLKTKAKLLQMSKYRIINIEDGSYKKLKELIKGDIITFGLKKGNYNLKNFSFKTKLLGVFNQRNCIAAAAATHILGVRKTIIKKAIASFKGVIGRMEEVKNKKGIRVFIDFAHTPNALKEALLTLKKLKPRKIIAVFGCAGLRDWQKRPLMGKIACDLADRVVLTAEDPRTEKIEDINKQILEGCRAKKKVLIENNRQKAIDLAINRIAKNNDLVAIFGKGHEQSLCFGNIEYPWSDHLAVKKALRKK